MQIEYHSDALPSAREFIDLHARQGRLAVLRGATPLFYGGVDWSDAALSATHGDMLLEVEVGKIERSRDGKLLVLSLAAFLERYRSEPLYAVTSLHNAKVRAKLLWPSVLACRSALDAADNLLLWMSSGSTSSLLHYDDVSNLNCLMAGKKVSTILS